MKECWWKLTDAMIQVPFALFKHENIQHRANGLHDSKRRSNTKRRGAAVGAQSATLARAKYPIYAQYYDMRVCGGGGG